MRGTENGRRAAIYVRVSTTKESQQMSPEHQEGVCREKARLLDLDVIEKYVYEDRDTGTIMVNRPAIKQMIIDARNNCFDIVIFASLSRFSRDALDSISLKRTLVDSIGLRLIALDEMYDSKYDIDELKFTMISAVNQKLSEQISLSSRRGKRQSALKGNFTGSLPPYGYKKIVDHNNRKTLISDEDTKEIVQLIYQLYTSHKMGEKEIVKYLNEEKKVPSPKGKVWGVSSIQRILQNEAYTGVNVFSKYETKMIYNNIDDLKDRRKKLVQRDKEKWERAREPQTHAAIISKELFALAQDIRLQRGGGKRGGVRNNKNLFAGMIKCAHCDSAMVTMKSKSKTTSRDGKEYRYLICSRRRRQGDAGCGNDFWLPYHPFKNDLLETISNKMGGISSVESLFGRHKDLIKIDCKDNEKKIAKLEKQIESNRKLLFELRKNKMLETMDEKQYEYEKEQYESEIAKYEKQLEECKKDMDKKNNLQELYEEVKDSLDDLLSLNFDDEVEFDELRFILTKLINKITVDRNGNIDVKTTFGLQLREIPDAESEVAAGKQ